MTAQSRLTHEKSIDALIPWAAAYADTYAKGDSVLWDRLFHRRMDELAARLGLRVQSWQAGGGYRVEGD